MGVAKEASDYERGQRLPGTSYEVTRLLGRGGMGTVYEVEDVELGKIYVLKTIHPELVARKDLVERMRREARTLAKLAHRNIVDVIAAGETSESPPRRYFVMERLRGVSLRELLARLGPLDPSKVYDILYELLEALGRAHEEKLVHRDVKPENIFLHVMPAGETVTKLLDFGIVAVLSNDARETGGRFLGTPRYAAPEQLLGQPVSAQTDLYAAALVAYEMLAGRGPFDDQRSSSLIMAAHAHTPAPRIRTFVDVPKDVDDVIAEALEKDPEKRPPSARDLALRLYALKSTRNTLGASQTSAKTEELLRVAVAKAQDDPSSDTASSAPTTVVGMATMTVAEAESAPARSASIETEREPVHPAPVENGTPTSHQPTAIDRAAATRTYSTPTRARAGSDTEGVSVPEDLSLSEDKPVSISHIEPGPPASRARWPIFVAGAGAFALSVFVADRWLSRETSDATIVPPVVGSSNIAPVQSPAPVAAADSVPPPADSAPVATPSPSFAAPLPSSNPGSVRPVQPSVAATASKPKEKHAAREDAKPAPTSSSASATRAVSKLPGAGL